MHKDIKLLFCTKADFIRIYLKETPKQDIYIYIYFTKVISLYPYMYNTSFDQDKDDN